MPSTRRRFLQLSAVTAAAAPLLHAQPARHAAPPPTLGPLAKHGTVQLSARDLGAVGDGKTKDTEALQLALDRLAVLGGGTLLVEGGTFVAGTLRLHSNITLHIAEGSTLLGSPDLADYPFTMVRWEGKWIRGYASLITAQDAENVTLTGKGTLQASPEIKARFRNADGTPWDRKRDQQKNNVARRDVLRHPALLEFTRCRNLTVEQLTTRGNDMWSTHPVYCEHVIFRNLDVHSGADGIDVDSCRDVLIENCTFDTRDDCISLKSGRGMEGNTIAIPCEDVVIRNCTLLDHDFACIGIGSELSGGVRNVRIEGCKCVGAKTFAIYIKTRPGRGAFLENISVRDLDVSGVGGGFLRFNLTNSGLQDPDPVPGDAGIPVARNFSFRNIRVRDIPQLVDGTGVDPRKPLEGLVIDGLHGTATKGIELANTRDAVLRNIQVTGLAGPQLRTSNVTGTGLTHAEVLPPPPVPAEVPSPATPYSLR